jgi:predicted flap endonuclease-1-like 5' DNA nuclease
VAAAEPTAAVTAAAAPEPLAQVADVPAEGQPPAAPAAGMLRAAPSGVASADDLTRIPGIGPKMAAALAAAGITTYRQLADADVPTLRTAIAAAGLRLAPTVPTWPDRAKQLADATG